MTGSPAPAAVITGPLLLGCTAARTGSGRRRTTHGLRNVLRTMQKAPILAPAITGDARWTPFG